MSASLPKESAKSPQWTIFRFWQTIMVDKSPIFCSRYAADLLWIYGLLKNSSNYSPLKNSNLPKTVSDPRKKIASDPPLQTLSGTKYS